MATNIDARPRFAPSGAADRPLESISERRWFTLGALIGTILVWTQISNAIAWIGFLALLTGILGWILYGNARSTRTTAGAAGVAAAWLAAIVSFGALVAAAISYADRTAAPSWVYTMIGVVIVTGVLGGAWRISAPLRADGTR